MTFQAPAEGKEVICPESTLESANRRNFIRKAALTAAAAGVGSTLLLPKNVVLSSSAVSNAGKCSMMVNCLVVDACALNEGGQYLPPPYTYGCVHVLSFGKVVCGHISGSAIGSAQNPLSSDDGCLNYHGLDFYTGSKRRLAITCSGKVGIGFHCCELGFPPSYQLEVVACNQQGILIEGPSSGVGAALSFQTICCSSYCYGWEILDTGEASPQGPKKLNIRNLNTSKDVFTICGPNSNIGINNTAPLSSYALCVNGTISGSSAGTAVLGVTCCGIGVLGCSTRCGTGVSGVGGKVGVEAVAATAGAIPIVAKGAPGQTANLQQWENSCGSVYAVINRAGSLGLGGVTNPHHVLSVSGKAWASGGFIVGPCICSPSGMLTVNGSIAARTRTVGSSTTLLTTDYAILATGTITLTLPPAKTQNGMMIFIKNTSTSTVSAAPGGTDTIEGSSTARTLTKQYDSLTLISNGSNEWFIQSGVKCGAVLS